MLLKWSLYGLKDATQICFDFLWDFFSALGFREMESSPRVLLKRGTITISHADGIIVFIQTESETKKFISSIRGTLKVKDLVEPTQHLGIAIKWVKDGEMFLIQEAYTSNILQ